METKQRDKRRNPEAVYMGGSPHREQAREDSSMVTRWTQNRHAIPFTPDHNSTSHGITFLSSRVKTAGVQLGGENKLNDIAAIGVRTKTGAEAYQPGRAQEERLTN